MNDKKELPKNVLFLEHYDLKNSDEKYDVVPEIWEGHNVLDFVQGDIAAKLEAIQFEEQQRIEAG